jgi:lipid kinase, YegS/Rv2252/BmrU family
LKKIKLIYNSGAGQSKFKYFLDPIIEKFMDNDIEVSIFRAANNTNLYEFLKDVDKDGYSAIVVAGGDGTVNRVVNVMMKNNIKTPLGVIPAGTSNDFARHLKMPQNFSECIDKLLTFNVQPVDVGKVNDKYFVNICSAGLFTNVSQKVDPNLKNSLGKLSYFITAVNQMVKFKPFEVKIETENDIYIEKVKVMLVFNGSSVGGIDAFCDNSSIQDGLLDMLIIKDCNIADTSLLAGKLFAKNHYTDKNVIYSKEKWIKITKTKGKCDLPDVDGDPGPNFPLEIKCVEGAINMLL